ncbi:Protein of unknown function (DUF2853) [Bartonella sp. A1379B]|uniref:DUF2853 family protein n=1 Tax=Bartonella sp. A1379B TaxID=1933910 RepID=UPI00099A6D0E|nr:DUF2853 family protein [Bartonella sp. A1379B]AQX18146.1 Protein of unknown function (DUF2853) [Bartonella sp. A1379B]
MVNDLENIKLYDVNPDEAVIERLRCRLTLVMRHQDASLVSTSDQKELERVVKWAQDVLDVDKENAQKAVAKVAEMMSGNRKKNRVTFYYLLAKQVNALDKI